MKRNILLTVSCVLIIVGLLAAVSCGSSTPATTPTPGTTTPPPTTQTQANAVTIQNLAFSPATLTVSVGTTVTWTNKDSTTHTVTSNTGLFDSGFLNNGATFSFTFNTKGTFEYHCSIHTTMHGTVTVQ